MKKLLLLPLLLFLSQPLSATTQMKDRLIYKGDTLELSNCPLELYFVANPHIQYQFKPPNSALWRGYLATFEIADGLLFVRDVEVIEPRCNNRQDDDDWWMWVSVIDKVLPVETYRYPEIASKGLNFTKDIFLVKSDRFAKWFTGSLIIVIRKDSVFSFEYDTADNQYIVLDVVDGVLKNDRRYTFEDMKVMTEFSHLCDVKY